jgi:arginyl-tRNA synthetase
MIRDVIKKLTQKALSDLMKNGEFLIEKLPEIKIEYPADRSMGDYATNVAFVLSKTESKNPRDIAKVITEKILSDKKAQEIFEKVESAGGGFINFTLSREFVQQYIGRPTPHAKIGKGKKLNIEFLSANPTGKFQVGNGRGGFYGDVLGNILRIAGYKVTKEYYVNNAKSSNQIQELGKTALGRGEKYLTEYVKEKIRRVVIGGGEVAEVGYLLAQEIHKDNLEFLKKIGIHYDVFTEEEELHKRGALKKILECLKKKNLVYEKEGAQWLKTTKFGDDKDKVLVRTSGEYGYYLADIAYHQDKIKRGYKVIIDILGADHQGHVAPMKIAMKIMGYTGKFDIFVSQLVQAKGGGKFSKRAGNVIELEELIEEVGVDAARYFYLMKSLNTQMEFDMDLAKEQSEKNPVYYVQYAHARMASILRNAQDNFQFFRQRRIRLRRTIFNFQTISKFSKLLKHSTELSLIKQLMRWPEVIEDTANDYQLQRVTAYAYDIATVFNQFYRDCKVISEDEPLTKARLALVVTAKNVLKEVLDTLGISAPEKM